MTVANSIPCRARQFPGRTGRAANAFTLVELLVVIAIIGVLIGMAVPAMQNMRELSRRSNCQYNLVRLSLGLSAYETRNEHFPIGTLNATGPIENVPVGYHHNWLEGLLPMMGSAIIYDAIDRDVSVYDKKNTPVRTMRIPDFLCPSASDLAENTTCYAGIHASTETPIDESNDGVFRLNQATTFDDITDGLSYTLFSGEKLSRLSEDLGWLSGTRSSLRNTGLGLNAERDRIRGVQTASNEVSAAYVGGLASDHPGGLHLLMGGGEVEFRSNQMDLEVLRQMASRSDGALPKELEATNPIAVDSGEQE
ncbi:hypothetical protein K227x_24320 [Rubripirellula lacrimiformis]|uniref:DUF1559 domain-containing protein n=1 Tax=Rubripirellula lacrimiformis TaxID=1930273 RepID=A0A517NA83_9BACT|nr:DUF1559 domain-containing protein [Rubripirellula lacrimiformis]QDT04046.1 hypothetical protein K227x_24320 [Rubripirellula lacrimiformis]